jgi:hypothetical protein
VGSEVSRLSKHGKHPKASTKLSGTVEKLIKPHPSAPEPEKAQIAVEGADRLYRELRVPNKLTDSEGNNVKLKEGTEVDVKIESDDVVTDGGSTARSSDRQ